MMILTDGKATDSPCTQDATLRALDVKVMVIGIGSQFETEKVPQILKRNSHIVFFPI